MWKNFNKKTSQKKPLKFWILIFREIANIKITYDFYGFWKVQLLRHLHIFLQILHHLFVVNKSEILNENNDENTEVI